jgi:hypothetical protein
VRLGSKVQGPRPKVGCRDGGNGDEYVVKVQFRIENLYLQGFRKIKVPEKVQFGAILVPEFPSHRGEPAFAANFHFLLSHRFKPSP